MNHIQWNWCFSEHHRRNLPTMVRPESLIQIKPPKAAPPRAHHVAKMIFSPNFPGPRTQDARGPLKPIATKNGRIANTMPPNQKGPCQRSLSFRFITNPPQRADVIACQSRESNIPAIPEEDGILIQRPPLCRTFYFLSGRIAGAAIAGSSLCFKDFRIASAVLFTLPL